MITDNIECGAGLIRPGGDPFVEQLVDERGIRCAAEPTDCRGDVGQQFEFAVDCVDVALLHRSPIIRPRARTCDSRCPSAEPRALDAVSLPPNLAGLWLRDNPLAANNSPISARDQLPTRRCVAAQAAHS
jgi:hypothetical protein